MTDTQTDPIAAMEKLAETFLMTVSNARSSDVRTMQIYLHDFASDYANHPADRHTAKQLETFIRQQLAKY